MGTLNLNLVEKKLRDAIDQLLEEDRFLLENDVNERSLSHKLAEYLQTRFPNWNVDCEYNRNHNLVKKLNIELPGSSAEDTEGTTVYPDIVVHRRNTDENLLVVEIKKSTNSDTGRYDMEKLRSFICELVYAYGAFIEFATRTENVDFNLEFGNENSFR